MKMAYPQIRIKYAWLLTNEASVYLNELWGDGKPLRRDDEYIEIVKSYKKAWVPFEKKTLKALTDVLGLTFRQNIIDVNIAPWFNAFSDPMVVGVNKEPSEFVDILTHEIIHRLLTDNNESSYDTLYADEWTNLFGKEHTFVTLVHIPVHAVHKYIYLDIMKKPENLKKDIDRCKKNNATDYIAAWDYVNKNDYMKIVGDLKKSYGRMRQ